MIERIVFIMHISDTVSLSNFIFPMNDMFSLSNEPYHEHEATKCHKPALATTTKNKKQASVYLNEMHDEKEKLLAFSYLFVPLLFLGMKGEKERNNKEQIIDVLTVTFFIL